MGFGNVLAVGFVDVCFFFSFFFFFFFPGSGGSDKCGCGWVCD